MNKKFFIGIIIVVILLTSCQPTPKKQIVGDKGEEYIQDMIDGSSTDTTDAQCTATKDQKKCLEYTAPQKLEYSLENEIEGYTTRVRVNADIIMPEYAPPVVSVKPVDISYDIVDGILSHIQGDSLLYDGDECAIVMFKDDVQSMIDKYEYELKMTDESNSDSRAFYKSKLKSLYSEMEKAPTTIEEANRMLASGEIECRVVVAPNSVIPARADEGIIEYRTEIKPFELTEQNYNDKSYRISMGMCTDNAASLSINTELSNKRPQEIEYYKGGSGFVDALIDLSIMYGFELNTDDATTVADTIVKTISNDLELFDILPAVKWNIDLSDYTPYGYKLIYTRNYNGVLANYSDSTHLSYPMNTKKYPQEYLAIVIGLDGIVQMEYTAPHEVIKVENMATLLPFDEIQQKFNEHIVLSKEDYDTYIKIYKIQLGMMRIAKPNSDEYLVIPVWDFYGVAIGATGMIRYTDDEYWEKIHPNPERSFLTINAIDGSIIDRALGY